MKSSRQQFYSMCIPSFFWGFWSTYMESNLCKSDPALDLHETNIVTVQVRHVWKVWKEGGVGV